MPIRGLGTVYGFDMGRRTGFCYGRPGEPPISGSWTLYKPSEGIEQGFANFLACVQELFEAERPSGFQIDDQLKFIRSIDWNFARLGAVEDQVHIVGKTSGNVADVRRVAHQPTQIHIVAERIDYRKMVCACQFGDSGPLRQKAATRVDHGGVEVL